MTKTLGRSLLFGLGGMLALALWGAIFGAVTGALAYSLLLVWSPNRHNSFVAVVMTAITTLAAGAGPLGGLSCLVAEATSPGLKLAPLLKLSVLRSLMGAFGLALVGSLAFYLASLVTDFFQGGSFLPSVYGWIAGWFGGFFGGIVWGSAEGVVKGKRAPRTMVRRASPPISAP